MTAFDFTGGNGDVAGGFKEGWSKESYNESNGESDIEHFFLPLLDDDGITDFQNHELTRNLLVYTKAGTKTDDVVSASTALADLAYQETDATYHTVDQSDDPWTKNVKGHWVQLTDAGYMAQRDHFLVDKEDFNCPILYTFSSDKRMWYQRDPRDMRYVDRTKGWEAISLPFQAEVVTTPDKGELTHFYQGSTTGHEYWLREFNGNLQQKKDANSQPVEGVYTADFNPLAVGNNTKDYTNTFLWDYYYSKDSYQDKNTDQYQQQYYSEDYLRSKYPVSNYPYPLVGSPYIVGFPGATYYEFDLSGTWEPKNRYQNGEIESKGKQAITFASAPGVAIGMSDGELQGVAKSNYTFTPTYLNDPEVAAGTDVYLLDAEGASFKKTAAADVKITAFRPYFTAPTGTNPARQTRGVEQIVFSQSNNQFGVEEHGDPSQGELNGGLRAYAKKHKIVVESSLHLPVEVRIVNTAGITVNTFTLESGESVETRVNNSGVYIVHSADGQYTKKLSVR